MRKNPQLTNSQQALQASRKTGDNSKIASLPEQKNALLPPLPKSESPQEHNPLHLTRGSSQIQSGRCLPGSHSGAFGGHRGRTSAHSVTASMQPDSSILATTSAGSRYRESGVFPPEQTHLQANNASVASHTNDLGRRSGQPMVIDTDEMEVTSDRSRPIHLNDFSGDSSSTSHSQQSPIPKLRSSTLPRSSGKSPKMEDALGQLDLGGIAGSSKDSALRASSPALNQSIEFESSRSDAFVPEPLDISTLNVLTVEPTELLQHLKNTNVIPGNDKAGPFPSDAPILLVDLRYVADFSRCRIKDSVNVNLPVLMLKRFRRGNVSSFQMTNFLTGTESKRLYEQWKTSDAQSPSNEATGTSMDHSQENPGSKVMIIYDEEMNEEAKDSEPWALISILSKGLAEDVYSGRPGGTSSPSQTRSSPHQSVPDGSSSSSNPPRIIIAYLRGGYRAFRACPGVADFIVSSTDGDENTATNSMHHLKPNQGAPFSNIPTSGHAGGLNTAPLNSNLSSALTPLNIRTGHPLYQMHTILGSPTTYNPGTPLTAEPSTPSDRAFALVNDSKQRKKSAFSINTTKLRSRGPSISANRRSQLGGEGINTAGVGGHKSTFSAAIEGPPMTAMYNKSMQIPTIPRTPYSRSEVPPPSAPLSSSNPNLVSDETPFANYRSGHRRSISENCAINSASPPGHSSSFHQTMSPGPSTMPTPIEPASEILPFLYLGSDTIPQSVDGIDILKKMGITHVLNMAQEVENKQIDQSGQFEVKWCMAEDHAEHDIEHTLKEAIEWIEGARQKSGKNIVFVHCKAGRSRSATTVIGYLVAHRGMSLKEAYETVKAARPGVSPNLGFMLALLKIEKEVRGETSSVLDCSA